MGDAAEIIPMQYISPLEEREEKYKKLVFWKKVGNNYDFDTILLYALLTNLGFVSIKINSKIEEVVKIDEANKIITTFESEKETLKAIIREIHSWIDKYEAACVAVAAAEKRKKINIPFDKIRDSFNKKVRFFLSLNIFLMKPAKDISKFKFINSTKDKAFYFFLNCIAEVRENEVLTHKYADRLRPDYLKNLYVWDFDRNKKRSFSVLDEIDYSKSNYFDFLDKLSLDVEKESKNDNDDENVLSDFQRLCAAIGYLCHTFKDPSIVKIIIMTEANLSTDAKGGTGKGINVQAIEHLFPEYSVVTIDGKTFDPNNRFKFSLVDKRTKVLHIDDLKQFVKAESFYNPASGKFEVERKNQNSESFSFKESPKIIITTNFPLVGDSESDNRRKHYVVLVPYFSINYQPKDFYGENFFDEEKWTELDWNRFLNVILFCVQTHLKYGLPEFNSDIFGLKKLQHAIGGDNGKKVYNWLESIPRNTYYEFSYLSKDYEEYVQTKIPKNFRTKIETYCEYKNLVYHEKQRFKGDARGFGLFEPDKIKD